MKVYNPSTVHTAPTYNHGVEVPPNARWLYISGQIGVGPDGKMKDGIEAQTQQVWENIKAVLAAAGMGVEDLVKLTAYLTDENTMDGFRKVRSQHLGSHKPASTLVVIKRLALPGLLVEVEAVAAKA
ncbi:MAG TPA: RidA family protein [Stellaceae bacterium]|nr:RidA family protein [Stellaceae bacterium]